MSNYTVNVTTEELAKTLGFSILENGRGSVPLCSRNISRPGLQFTGYFEHFDHTRIQVIGMAEHEYMNSLPMDFTLKVFTELFKRNIPCLIVSRNLKIAPEILELAKEYGCPVFGSEQITTHLINQAYSYLSRLLAKETMVHGVLVDVSGVGILLEGDAGIGKSEIALELINRGHRLVADDCVIIRLINDNLTGTAPEKIRDYMEIRGLGIINIQTMYGPGSVRKEKGIDIVVKLERWDEKKEYDRIGDIDFTENILGVDVFQLLIPVTPGRNIPTIIETAAKKYRLKQVGYDAAHELLGKVLR
ncbi:MAG: HPr(Ser) kinase/phosphatase [Christensenellaceae bacterium]|nr:HPr(Ser) kinase/phosphatase [Christensenellaceae bacterium]